MSDPTITRRKKSVLAAIRAQNSSMDINPKSLEEELVLAKIRISELEAQVQQLNKTISEFYGDDTLTSEDERLAKWFENAPDVRNNSDLLEETTIFIDSPVKI